MSLKAFADLVKKAITVACFLFEKLHFNRCLHGLFGEIKQQRYVPILEVLSILLSNLLILRGFI